MSANDLLRFLTQALLVLVFLVVVVKAVHQPRRASIDTALLFGVASLLVAESWAAPLLHLRTNPLLVATSSGLIMALPYLLVRLVDDFAHVPPPVLYGALVGLGIAVPSFFMVPPRNRPLGLTLLYVAYFVGLTVYTSVAFARTALRSRGITRRRMPPCQADPGLLQQVFVNLLDHAPKFTAHRNVARIAVGCCDRGGEPVYFVRDNNAPPRLSQA